MRKCTYIEAIKSIYNKGNYEIIMSAWGECLLAYSRAFDDLKTGTKKLFDVLFGVAALSTFMISGPISALLVMKMIDNKIAEQRRAKS